MQIASVSRPLVPMAGQSWHVEWSNRDRFWAVRQETSTMFWGLYLTKIEAVAAGIQQARSGRTELIQHTRDGRVQKITDYTHWYGPDPEE